MKCLAFLAFLLVTQDPDIDGLIRKLEEDSPVTRDEAVKALVEAGEKALPKLKARMASAEGQLRALCGQVIEQIAIPKPLRGILPPITRVTIDAQDRSLRDVLEELRTQTRMPMKLGRAEHGSHWPKVSVRIVDATPLEALNAVCRAAKYYWYIPDRNGFGRPEIVIREEPKVALHQGPEINFAQGDYDKPRLFIRHYQVEVWEIQLSKSNDFKKPKTRGEVSFGMNWPAGVNPHALRFEVASAVDDRGNELLEGHDDPSYPKGPRYETFWEAGRLSFYHRYRLRYPEKGAKAIASVRGTARFHYLLRAKTVSFEASEKSVGIRKEIDGVTAQILEFKQDPSHVMIRLRIDGSASGDPPRVRALLEDGKCAATMVGNRDRKSSEPIYGVYIIGDGSKFASLEIAVDTVTAVDAFDFEFKDVPLP